MNSAHLTHHDVSNDPGGYKPFRGRGLHLPPKLVLTSGYVFAGGVGRGDSKNNE